MDRRHGFWKGMSARIRVRLFLGLLYVAVAAASLAQQPILGIVLLMLPILWTVLVIWLGSESGYGFGPHAIKRETAFSHTVRYLWGASAFSRVLTGMLIALVTVGGLGWLSTENMRAKANEATFTERVVTTTETATEATKDTAKGWFSTAKGWFTSEE